MRLATCLVTHNRWPLTARCLDTLIDTQGAGDGLLVIVDNASTDGTVDHLATFGGDALILNASNRYPGAACNQGWELILQEFDADLLHRSDNDIEYLPGWREEVEAAFTQHPDLALLGILNLHEDRGVEWPDGEPGDIEPTGAVGGNIVMPRSMWDRGLRWNETPWQPGGNEDAYMSGNAANYGTVAMLVRTVANNMAFCRYWDYPDYYNQTASARGLADAEHSV